MSIESLMPSNHLILCSPLLLLPLIFPIVSERSEAQACSDLLVLELMATQSLEGQDAPPGYPEFLAGLELQR